MKSGELTQKEARHLEREQARVKRMEAQQRTDTIGRVLHDMNLPATIREDNGFYLRILGYGAGAQQPGAALAGAWAARNLAICARLAQVARPGDRIVAYVKDIDREARGCPHILHREVLARGDPRLLQHGEASRLRGRPP